MKRPAIQFYFGDWLRNAKLRRCSWGARGVLVEVMALLHDSDEYGALRWPIAEIARAVGCPPTLVKELAEKQVLKGSDKRVEAYRWAPSHAGQRGPEVVLVPEQPGPLWYSSRMVRDEYKRSNRGITTRFPSPNQPPTTPPKASPNRSPSHRDGDDKGNPNQSPSHREGDGASSAFASAINGVQNPGIDAHATPTATPLGDRSPLKINGNGTPAPGWWKTSGGITAEGERQGERPRRGETETEYKGRLFAKLHPGEAILP